MTKLVNRAKMTTATTGIGTITLGSAVDGYQTFADAGVVNSDVVRYVIEDGVNWEIGSGTYSAGTLTRTVSESSNAGAAINLSGEAVVYITAVAADLLEKRIGAVTGNATLDLSSGTVFSHTPTANTTFVFSNPPASGTGYEFSLQVAGVQLNDVYNLASASYDSVSFSIGSQETAPRGIAFNSAGTKMYVCGVASDSIYQYSLSTAFDLSTASYDSVSFNPSSQDNSPQDLRFNLAGTKMYVLGGVSDSVYQYSLSTAFDISTASYDSISFSVTSQEGSPLGIEFNSDGTKMYVVGISSDTVYEYSLSTGFDLSSASYNSVSFSVSSQDTFPAGLAFNSNGTKMFVVGFSGDSVYQYSLSTAFDISTASYDSISFSVTSQDTDPRGIAFNSDGTKMYILGQINDTVFQYTTGAGTYTPTFSYPASVKWPSGTVPTSPAVGEIDLLQFLTVDGGTTYLGRVLGDNFS